MLDQRICWAHLKKGSKSFAFAGRLLPKQTAIDAAALYAFCRIADDLIDEGDNPQQAHQLLQARLDALVAAAARGVAAIEQLPHAEDRSLARLMARHRLPRAAIDALLEGFLWDAQGRSYITREDTMAYAARVAGSVGMCMAWLMGQRDVTVLARAIDLGVAMQLTNIARDIYEDAIRGRCYLPLQDLQKHHLNTAIVVAAANSSTPMGYHNTLRGIEAVICELLDDANMLYARGRSGISSLPWQARWGIDAAARLYQAIGDELLRHQPFTLHRRAVVPLWRKLVLVAGCLLPARSHKKALCGRYDAPLPATQFLLEPLT